MTETDNAAKRRREDRISKLDDRVLGHVLSFLPSLEAARAAVLSTRWRDTFAGVHTLWLEEPGDRPIPNYEYDDYRRRDPDYYYKELHHPPSLFGATIFAAIVARHRRPGDTKVPPIRALRVTLHNYRCRDSLAVDQWVSYALKQAGPKLELDLRLRRLPIHCRRAYPASLDVPAGGNGAAVASTQEPEEDPIVDGDEIDDHHRGGDDDDDVVSSVDETVPWVPQLLDYTVPGSLFSCAALRSLRIGSCRLSPPSSISLPSLEELLLTCVSDGEEEVQRPFRQWKDVELVDGHILEYNRYNVLDAPSAVIPCLVNRVREINLVHYHGGRAQRTLAKFLLCNAPFIDKLWCQFAEGPLWIQTELMREMKVWVLNEKADTVFR